MPPASQPAAETAPNCASAMWCSSHDTSSSPYACECCTSTPPPTHRQTEETEAHLLQVEDGGDALCRQVVDVERVARLAAHNHVGLNVVVVDGTVKVVLKGVVQLLPPHLLRHLLQGSGAGRAGRGRRERAALGVWPSELLGALAGLAPRTLVMPGTHDSQKRAHGGEGGLHAQHMWGRCRPQAAGRGYRPPRARSSPCCTGKLAALRCSPAGGALPP